MREFKVIRGSDSNRHNKFHISVGFEREQWGVGEYMVGVTSFLHEKSVSVNFEFSSNMYTS